MANEINEAKKETFFGVLFGVGSLVVTTPIRLIGGVGIGIINKLQGKPFAHGSEKANEIWDRSRDICIKFGDTHDETIKRTLVKEAVSAVGKAAINSLKREWAEGGDSGQSHESQPKPRS